MLNCNENPIAMKSVIWRTVTSNFGNVGRVSGNVAGVTAKNCGVVAQVASVTL